MTRTNQKTEEMRLVEQMRQLLGGAPAGHVEPGDEPDVFVVLGQHRTGIEVTELHQHSRPGEGPRRRQESERWGIVRRAQELAAASGMPIVDVAVHFNDSKPIAKGDREALVKGLLDVVSDHMPDIGGSVVQELWRLGNPLPPVRTIRIYRAEVLTRHHWAVPDSGWVQMDFIPELQSAIDGKNVRHPRYQRHCDECWLLIVASGGRPSGLFEASEATRSHVYRSSFSKTLFMEAFGGVLVELHTAAA